MSEALPPSLIHRIRHTPMRDVVRGRLTGRLDWRRLIDASELPAPAKNLVKRVVKRTRLWALEKIDVANELLAHFADGLDSGATVEELLESFGDERLAARLIGRAKKRNRPLAAQVLRALGWALLGVILLYLALSVRFFIGRPSPSENYFAVLNRHAAQFPADQRAWPLYRTALLSIGDHSPEQRKQLWELLNARPGNPGWPELNDWLNEHNQAVNLLREASQKPVLGFILGPGGSDDDPDLWPERTESQWEPLWRYSLLHQGLWHLNDLYAIVSILAADANLAREQRDSRRLIADITAMIDMARQTQADRSIYSDQRALSIRLLAMSEIERTLIDSPQLFSDADLQSLAHVLSGPDIASELISLDNDRIRFHDTVQRMYTDDGAGDGRLTWQGIRFTGYWEFADLARTDRIIRLALPAMSLPVASRRQLVDEFNRMMDLADLRLAQPRQEANWSPFQERWESLARSSQDRLKFGLLLYLMPPLEFLHNHAERYIARRDGILVGIALELYRRQRGSYPLTLAELTPALLPRVPVDRITGDPVLYRLVDGKPIVYSVGADRDDDGGRPTVGRTGNIEPIRAANWVPKDHADDGDWVLYPEPREPQTTGE